MCAGSMIIACTPGHASIGAAAPAILVFARLLQGLSVGGEYGASATYLSEVAERSRRGFWSSLVQHHDRDAILFGDTVEYPLLFFFLWAHRHRVQNR
jgi:MFS family permease